MWRHGMMGLVLVAAGLTVTSRATPAQEPPLWHGPMMATANPMVSVPGYMPDVEPGQEPNHHWRPVRNALGWYKEYLNQHGLACWTHHNTLGCNSLEAEFYFIFGSCRTFYGEPCEQRPPLPPPGTPGYGMPPFGAYGYGPAPTGCSCP